MEDPKAIRELIRAVYYLGYCNGVEDQRVCLFGKIRHGGTKRAYKETITETAKAFGSPKADAKAIVDYWTGEEKS